MQKKTIYKLLILVALIASAFFVLLNPEVREHFEKPGRVRQFINSFGPFFAPIVFVFIYWIRTFLIVFPVAIFAIMSSSFFGFIPGFIYSMAGAFLSASIAFVIGRYVARDTVNKYLSGRIKFLSGKKPKGFKVILYLRLIMVMPYDAFSYAVGATKITYKDFILGTMLGILPEFLGYAYIGGYLHKNADMDLRQKIFLSAVFISILLLGHVIKKVFERIKNGNTD